MNIENLGHFQLGQDVNGERPGVTICQLTDIHHWPKGKQDFHTRGRVIEFGVEGYSAEENVHLIENVLEAGKPDLVIFTGDIIDGRPFSEMGANEDSFIENMTELISPLVSSGIPWTFLPGNHDDDNSPWNREDLLKLFALPGCLTKDAKTFNFTFTVGVTESPSPESSVRIWALDSGGNNPDPKVMYDTFPNEIVHSYRQLSTDGSLEESALGLAYFHIPLPEYAGLNPVNGHNGLFEAALMGGKVPFPFNYEPFTSLVRWLGKDRVVGSSKLNSGLFTAMKETGNILATFCGHDHHSDAVFQRNGIYLCYGRVNSSCFQRARHLLILLIFRYLGIHRRSTGKGLVSIAILICLYL